jgi:hypothetical protein
LKSACSSASPTRGPGWTPVWPALSGLIAYLKLDADGLITELTVMVRPLSGLIALAQAMSERVAAA